MTEIVKKSKWGIGIFAFYGAFLFFILALVMYVSIQDFQMVEDDYYEKDQAYQMQIDKIERASNLESEVKFGFSSDGKFLEVVFPIDSGMVVGGEIVLYRPSNARYDVIVPISVNNEGVQVVDISKLAKGNWQVKIDWVADEISYYSQSQVYIN